MLKEIFVFDYCTVTKLFWRLRNTLKNNPKRTLKNRYLKFLYNRIMTKFNGSIPLEANIKKFNTPHGLNGIFISEKAVIGEGCTIFQQVTIGSITSKGSKHVGAPHIGDDVYIGAGAKILGDICIGNHVRIGANCIVTESVSDNCTVVMTKPRIISKKENDNTFVPINMLVEGDSIK